MKSRYAAALALPPRATLPEVVGNIYRLGPVTMTAMVMPVAILLGRSPVEHGIWVICIAYSYVALALIWHISLLYATGRPYAMTLYLFINLPILFWMTVLYAETYMAGPRYWEHPM